MHVAPLTRRSKHGLDQPNYITLPLADAELTPGLPIIP